MNNDRMLDAAELDKVSGGIDRLLCRPSSALSTRSVAPITPTAQLTRRLATRSDVNHAQQKRAASVDGLFLSNLLPPAPGRGHG
jgi:hypothetical protein